MTIVFGLLYTLFCTLPGFSTFGVNIFWALFMLTTGFSIAHFLSYILTDIVFSKLRGKASSDLLRFIVSIVLYTLCMTIILKFILGWDLTALLTTSALLTAVIGFALQTTLGNLFAGIAIQLEQAFFLGDVLKIDNYSGHVETLRWRSMTIRTFDGTRLIIPNNQISTKTIEVFPNKKPVRITVKIPAPYHISPEFISNLIRKVILETPFVFTEKDPFIQISEYDTICGVIWYQIKYFVNNYLVKPIVDTDVKNRIWYAFHRNHLNVCYSSHTEQQHMHATVHKKNYPDISKKDMIHCLSKIYKNCSPKELNRILDSVIVYVYASGEPILYTEPEKEGIIYIYQGIVKIHQNNEDILIQPYNENENLVEHWPTEELKKIHEHLTQYTGPISGKLIHKAANRTLDIKHLYHLLSLNIDDSHDRQQFLSHAPEYSYKFLLNHSSFFLSDILATKAYSQGETILLIIPEITTHKVSEKDYNS